jgi:hypothetical protein
MPTNNEGQAGETMTIDDDLGSQDTLDDDASDGRTIENYDTEREKLLCEWRDRFELMVESDGDDTTARLWAATHIKEVVALPDRSGEAFEQWIFMEPKPGCKFVPPNVMWKRFADFSDRQSLKIKRGIGKESGTPLPHIKKVQPTYLLDGIISTTDLVLLYGGEKEGKSTFGHKVGIVVASENLDLDGIPVKHGRVLYVSLDPGARKPQVGVRMEAICKRLGIEQPERLIVDHETVFLDDAMSVESMLQRNPGEFVLVIIDPLYRALSGGDPSHAGAINLAIESVIRIQQQTGAAVMILNHDTKTGGMYGSKFLGAAADCKIFMQRDFKTNIVTLKVELSKNTGALDLPPIRYRLDKEHLERLDAPKQHVDEPAIVTRPDMLALMPSTWTPIKTARELIEHLLTAPTDRGKDKEWERIRERWEAARLIEKRMRKLRKVSS